MLRLSISGIQRVNKLSRTFAGDHRVAVLCRKFTDFPSLSQDWKVLLKKQALRPNNQLPPPLHPKRWRLMILLGHQNTHAGRALYFRKSNTDDPEVKVFLTTDAGSTGHLFSFRDGAYGQAVITCQVGLSVISKSIEVQSVR